MIQNLNVVIAHGSDDTLEAVAAAIRTSHNIVARCSTIVELKSAITVDKPDVVVTGIVFPDGDGLETMIEVGEIDRRARHKGWR